MTHQKDWGKQTTSIELYADSDRIEAGFKLIQKHCSTAFQGLQMRIRVHQIDARGTAVTSEKSMDSRPEQIQTEIQNEGADRRIRYRIHTRNDGHVIEYDEPTDCYRAIFHLLTHELPESSERTVYHCFERRGAMLDLSRDAVYTVDKIKDFLCLLALCGFNTCYLYMEDLYPIAEYPYFGYLRGRYRCEELREIDRFASSLGIEAVPCIQSLAHLKTTLRWDYSRQFRDTADCLMVGEAETYELIRAMFRSLKDCFTSKRIHIGMDEAMDLGCGARLRRYGYTPPFELMMEHLERVSQIAAEEDLEPMIWDDMFYRSKSPRHDYYDPDVQLDTEDIARIPSEISLVYWDYYHDRQQDYASRLEQRKALISRLIFAGGIWKWNGFVPLYDKSFLSSRSALAACARYGVREVMATLWGDDGAETPLDTVLPGLLYFASLCDQRGGEEIPEKQGTQSAGTVLTQEELVELDRACICLSGLSFSAYQHIEELDLPPAVTRPNLSCLNPSKYLLYQDLLLGAFDAYANGTATHYAACRQAIDTDLDTPDLPQSSRRLLDFYKSLAAVLEHKAELGLRIRKAYKDGARSELSALAAEVLHLYTEITIFHANFKTLWLADAKGTGLEVHDLRLGGLAARCQTVSERIRTYLAGEAPCLDELEQEILPYSRYTSLTQAMPACNEHRMIVSQNSL